ncbi:MAG TPA: pantetheine-phosphate adenylyltransferase [Kiritimatiellia bacterium]|nr:pantetheine-phosphate adenylyltransferase [Kiritimatiellia bacterium]HRZ12142.1 pantetheine-phosphate adenylyltransferase [Kiritimatiellia bacterium]HSA18100.1 pantetheine-phosphate adenylyltransferase [Kiritimatiellia bacterium]
MNRAAIYAGTFDPITLGHLDVIERAARIFNRLILAVAVSTRKATLFSVEERRALVRNVVRRFKNVEVDIFDGLLVQYARKKGVRVLVRGLRAFSDFEFEFQMALTNRKMAPDIETLFLMPKEDFSYVSSSTVREVAQYGGDTSSFVAPSVERALQAKLKPRG